GDRLESLPAVLLGRSVAAGAIEQAEARGAAVLGIGAGQPWDHFEESERHEYGQRVLDVPHSDAEIAKIAIGHDEIAVASPAVVGQLDLDAVETFSRRDPQNLPSRAFQHVDHPGGELALDGVRP